MPFKFGPAVELCGLGNISDALIGRRSSESALVLKERDFLLTCSGTEFNRWYGHWKKNATKRVNEAWEAVKENERVLYGKRSYFALLEEHPGGLASFPEIRPDDEVFSPDQISGLKSEVGDISGDRQEVENLTTMDSTAMQTEDHEIS